MESIQLKLKSMLVIDELRLLRSGSCMNARFRQSSLCCVIEQLVGTWLHAGVQDSVKVTQRITRVHHIHLKIKL